jgi:hypothetical protein
MIETLEANGYIGFGDAITTERLTTPADWEAQGMAAGVHLLRCESLVHADGAVSTAESLGDNVVFTGSGTTPGVGVPMVLISGKLAAQRITDDDVRTSQAEQPRSFASASVPKRLGNGEWELTAGPDWAQGRTLSAALSERQSPRAMTDLVPTDLSLRTLSISSCRANQS